MGKLNIERKRILVSSFQNLDLISVLKKEILRNLFIPKGGSNNYYFYFTDPGTLANQYRAKLSVAPRDKDASLVTLSVSGFVPEQEADYLNMLMDVYIDYGLDFKKQIAEQTISFINNQLNSNF